MARPRNPMVKGQRWRYWAHRWGILPSPSCGLLGHPFGWWRA